MKRIRFTIVVFCMAVLVPLGICQLRGQSSKTGVDRLYVLDCGDGNGLDESKWTPGQNVNQWIALPDHCYLIHHSKGWFLWDTGVSDALAEKPNHEETFHEWGPGTGPVWRKPVTLQDQLAALHVRPSDVRWVGISHSHPDHAGNVELFPSATLYVQRTEYTWAGSRQDTVAFIKQHPVHLVDGDFDIFGDGSLTLLSTPGHTPGHQSLLVRLPRTGPVILSGDCAHFLTSFAHRYVPSNNWSQEASRRSMDKLADVMAREHAQLWINHDQDQSNQLHMSPGFYE